jgi:tRNA threonylcarbamoyladenosine biosynthesis protein TsaE
MTTSLIDINSPIRCANEGELQAFAGSLGAQLRGGEVFALTGDLGMGKTTFVKGLASGMGSVQTVTSPTFNLVHRYAGRRLTLVHYDLYRIKHPRELDELDLELEMANPQHVIAIEWPQVAREILPSGRTYWLEFSEIEPEGRLVQLVQGG